MKSRSETPASVKIIGWFYVVVSGMMFFSGVMGYMAWQYIVRQEQAEVSTFIEYNWVNEVIYSTQNEISFTVNDPQDVSFVLPNRLGTRIKKQGINGGSRDEEIERNILEVFCGEEVGETWWFTTTPKRR